MFYTLLLSFILLFCVSTADDQVDSGKLLNYYKYSIGNAWVPECPEGNFEF